MAERGTKEKRTDSKAQLAAFRKAARELGCDESEDRLKDALLKVARRRPPGEPKKKGESD